MSADRERSVHALAEAVVRLNKAGNAMRNQLAARAGQEEWAAHVLLGWIVKEGPYRSAELAEAACLDPSTVSRQVAHLVEDGLIERGPDPADRRAALLQATDVGRRLWEQHLQRRAETFARIVEDWPAADVATLADLLARFNDSFARVRPQLLADIEARSERTA